MENYNSNKKKPTAKLIGTRLKAAREKDLLTRQQFCDLVNNLAESNQKNTMLNEATLKQWEYGNNKIDIEWIPYICQALHCDTGFLFGEHVQRTKNATDICAYTGLSESAVERLHKILVNSAGNDLEREEALRKVCYLFLEDLIEYRDLYSLAVFNNNYLLEWPSKFFIIDEKGIPVDKLEKKDAWYILFTRALDDFITYQKQRISRRN